MRRLAGAAQTGPRNYQQQLRDRGWSSSSTQAHFRHVSGAEVRHSAGLWLAVRVDEQRLEGIVHRATAFAWALGAEVSPWTKPEVAEKAPPARPAEPGRVGVGRGIWRHPRGVLDDGCKPIVATLKNGERRLFRERRDAVLWVEGNGVFKPGHAP